MRIKILRSALVAGATLMATMGFAGAATAQPAVDLPDVNVGNDACVLPWYWQGPFNVVTEDETGTYEACTGEAASEAEGINIVNDLCAAPWLWQGPVNLFTAEQRADYEACNTTAAEEEPPGDEPPGDEPPGDDPPGDDPPGDDPPGDDPPGDEPRIELSVLEPICDGDVPYLQYSVDAAGFDPGRARIVWINPDGSDVVYEDLPLSGRVLWPGAEVDEAGNPLDWPGWTQQADGTWVEGDEFDWVRPSVQVRFEVNPEETVTVDYPPASPQCATNPPGTDQSGGLPDTGVPLAGLAIAAGLSAAGGGVLGLRKLLNR